MRVQRPGADVKHDHSMQDAARCHPLTIIAPHRCMTCGLHIASITVSKADMNRLPYVKS